MIESGKEGVGWGREVIKKEAAMEIEERERASSKTLILKDSSVRSIWTYLTASPCYATNTNKQRERERDTDRQRQRQKTDRQRELEICNAQG